MEYTILIYKAEEGGFWAEVPALSGCYSQGETVEETIENIKEAIEAHLLALKEEKEQEKAQRKVYSIDSGLSNAIGFRFTKNSGKLMENIVATELRTRQTF